MTRSQGMVSRERRRLSSRGLGSQTGMLAIPCPRAAPVTREPLGKAASARLDPSPTPAFAEQRPRYRCDVFSRVIGGGCWPSADSRDVVAHELPGARALEVRDGGDVRRGVRAVADRALRGKRGDWPLLGIISRGNRSPFRGFARSFSGQFGIVTSRHNRTISQAFRDLRRFATASFPNWISPGPIPSAGVEKRYLLTADEPL